MLNERTLIKVYKKILPLNYPFITHKPTIAHLLSILETNPSTNSWIISNYSNLYINKLGKADFWGKDNLYNNCPWIFTNTIPRELVKTYKIEIINFCKVNLDLNYYINVMINEKHIKNYNNQKDFTHNMLIYGLDDEHQLVYFADFLKNMKYSFATCSYTELINAFNDPFIDYEGDYESIRTIKLKNVLFEFELDLIKSNLKDYISSINLFCKYNKMPFEECLLMTNNHKYPYFTNNYLEDNYFFGLNFYNQLTILFNEKKFRDVRAFHLIYDKMILIDACLNYLKDNNLVNNFEELTILSKHNISLALKLKNMILKTILTENIDLNKRIVENINILQNSDHEFCKILLHSI